MEKRAFPHVTSYIDRHGKRRFRYRRRGHGDHSFRAEFGTPAFAQEYRWVMENKVAGYVPARPKNWDKRKLEVRLSEMRGADLIYFVAAANGPVKIGRTNNIESRLLRLQVGHHIPLRLLALLPGGIKEEADLHKRFAESRVRGEWFRRSPEMNALIRANPIKRWRTELLGSPNQVPIP